MYTPHSTLLLQHFAYNALLLHIYINTIYYRQQQQSRQLLYKHAAIEAAYIAAKKQARYDYLWLYGVRDITENLLLHWHATARQQVITKLQCIAETDRLRWLAQVTAINIAQVLYLQMP
jgi:hypothetical protein